MNDNKLVICPKCIKDFQNVPYTSPFQFRGLYTNFKVPNDNLCNKCKEKLEVTEVTMDEIKILFAISHDNSFLKSMIDLKEKDIIEYNLKLSQFKSQLEQQESSKTQNDATPRCPTCGSANIKPISATERATSIIGLGIFSKKINKTYKCLNCKCTW